MSTQSSTSFPGVGLDLNAGEGWVFNRTSATVLEVGDYISTDDADSTTATTATGGATIGGAASFLANAVLPTTAGAGAVASAVRSFGGLVVDLGSGAGAVGALVKIRARGYASFKATAAVTIGSLVAPQDGATTLDDTTVAGAVMVAKALVAASGAYSSTLALTPCYINSIEGLQQSYAS